MVEMSVRKKQKERVFIMELRELNGDWCQFSRSEANYGSAGTAVTGAGRCDASWINTLAAELGETKLVACQEQLFIMMLLLDSRRAFRKQRA